MTPLYIFDLDGTLALIEHRRELIQHRDCFYCHGCGETPGVPECKECNGTGRLKPDWPAFFRACVDDEPNWPVISTMMTLIRAGADVRIWSGRSSAVMNETIEWLQRYVSDDVDLDELQLVMRREGDFTPDEELKSGWLAAMTEYDRRRLVAVFDDRDKVVSMWRARGVACFQVAPGAF